MAQGKRAGSRRAPGPRSGPDAKTLGYAGGITACVIAWGYLVYAAVDFGSSARTGTGGAWILLALAAVGAAACLFVGLMLALRLIENLGQSPRSGDQGEDAPPRPPGGRRAAR